MPHNEEQLISLSHLKLGQRAQIVAFTVNTGNGEQVKEMGFVTGDLLEIVRLPPSGDPIEIKIRGYFFSLSKEQADHIKVKLVSD